MIRRALFRIGLPVLALLALGSASWSIYRSNVAMAAATPAGAQEAAPAAVSEKAAAPVVGALGRTEPPGGVRAIAPERAGIVTDVTVAVGDRVKAGDLLFRLSDRALKAALAEREAELGSARAKLAQTVAEADVLRAERDQADAAVSSAEVRVKELQRDLEVGQSLAASSTVTARDNEKRAAALEEGQADLRAAEAAAARAAAALRQADGEAGADVLAARSSVVEAEARLATAQSDLRALDVRALEDGLVLAVDIRPGETADPSRTAVELAATGGVVLRVFVDEADAPLIDVSKPGAALPRGAAGPPVAVTYLSTEPVVQANKELSGRADEIIDTRVVELLYALPEGEATLYGESFDVTLPAKSGTP